MSASAGKSPPSAVACASAGDDDPRETASPFRPRPRIGARDFLCAGLIVAAVLLVGGRDISEGGLGWSDAPNHTFDGVFILEYARHCWSEGRLVLDRTELRTGAEQFYIRHPALGIVVYWPPGFAIVEAVVFASFGVGIVTARATVLFFAAGAGLLMYALGRRWFGRSSGLLAGLLLITCPHGIWWMNDVMLEWPATFWILAAVWAYQHDRDTRKKRWPILLAFALVASFLTKQTAGFIIPGLLIHALVSSDRRTYLRRPFLIASVVAAILMILAYALTTRGQSALAPELLRPSFDFLFYPRHLPEILGLPFLPIALLGLLTFIIAPDRGARGLLLTWFFVWTAFCSVIAAKEPRYFFFAVPPLCFAAVRFFARPREDDEAARPSNQRHQAPRLVLLAALVVTQAVLGLVESTGRLPAYAAAVAELARRPDADLVLVDAVRDGQFVFDAYENGSTRDKIIPLRASKLLYARAARMQYGGRVLVESEQDILNCLDRYGIHYVVIESALPRTHYLDADPQPRRLLRQLLATDPRFKLVKSWPLRCGDPIWDDVELRLYAYPDCPPRATKEITLSFPGMGRDVTFTLP